MSSSELGKVQCKLTIEFTAINSDLCRLLATSFINGNKLAYLKISHLSICQMISMFVRHLNHTR